MAILPNAAPVRVFWLQPDVVMQAQINMPGTISYPVQDLVYDNVSAGSFGACEADMLFTLGSTPGADDLGRGRLRAQPTSTILKVGRSSQGTEDGQVSVVDNAYVTVWWDYRIFAKISTIQNFVEFKDSDLAVGTNTSEPPPMSNTGPVYARRIDPATGKITVSLDGTGSFAVADGATIAAWAWDIKDGTILFGGAASDAQITVEYEAGFRWASLTVTDSNSKTNTARLAILADDPNDSLCVSGMQVQNISRTQQGSTARLRLLQDLPRSASPVAGAATGYMDGSLVIIWEDRDPAIYGTPDPTDHQNILHVGWHQSDQASSRALVTHLQRETTLTCVDVLGRLDSLPGLAQRLEVPDAEEGLTWGEMPAANMDKFLCYLIHWHSTAAGVADFFPSGTWDEYPFVLFDSAGATLYEQLQRQAERIVPDHNFTSDRDGTMRVVVNPQFQNTEDRTAVIQNSLTVQAWSEIDYTYTRPPRVHTTRGSALLTQTEWILVADASQPSGFRKTLKPPVFAIAPGTAPGQGGREVTLGERLAKSQQDLNDVVGHHHAHSNARYGPFNVALTINADPWDFDPAAHTWVHLIITAANAPQRGIDFETTRCLCQEVSVDFNYTEEATEYRARVILTVETVGLPALTEVQDEALPVGEQPTPAPTAPDFGLVEGVGMVAGVDLDGYIYRTTDFQTLASSGGPTWDRVDTGITEVIYSFVVDPFSPGYIAGVGAINGWIATETDIYRVTDMFGTTPTVTSVHTFAVTATASSFHWRSIQASFGAYFAEGDNPWLLCISYYADSAGHTGTWALRSVDGGATWETEVQVSAHYSEGAATRFNPIGVYTSPKTPGLAYTAAHIETNVLPLADGYVSDDWGETWARVSADPVDDPAHPLPRWGYSTGVGDFTLGPLAAATGTGALKEAPPTGSASAFLILAPPPDAVRVVVEGYWECEVVIFIGGIGGGNMSIDDELEISRTDDLNFIAPPPGGGVSAGSYTAEFTLGGGGDWPVNTETIVSSPPTGPDGVRIEVRPNAQSSGEDSHVTSGIKTWVRVTEIELDDGTIYTPGDYGVGSIQPGHIFGGTLHYPWESNNDEQLVYYGYLDRLSTRDFRLRRTIGTTISDISPSDGSRNYGVNKFGFAIRALDSNRQHLLVAGIGNDTSLDADDDQHGIFYSDDFGASWTTVVSPIADDAAFAGRPPFEAAFSPSDPDTYFVWGPAEYISYTDSGAAGLDDRSGNLSTFSPEGMIGIVGGPEA